MCTLEKIKLDIFANVPGGMRAVESYFRFPFPEWESTSTSLIGGTLSIVAIRVWYGIVLQQAATTLVSLDLVYFGFPNSTPS